MTKKKKKQSSAVINNRRALYDYQTGNKVVAGIVLSGPEVRALRQARVSLKGVFVNCKEHECYLQNMAIFTASEKQETKQYKLLLTKAQIRKLESALSSGYNTIVVTRLLLAKRYIKVEIAPAKGRRRYDKRQLLREREGQRQINRRLKR